jgi:hypothetical protein
VNAAVVPFGTKPGTHTWLHPECFHAWHGARCTQAVQVLTLMGVGPVPSK